jgi:hypothetical protein
MKTVTSLVDVMGLRRFSTERARTRTSVRVKTHSLKGDNATRQAAKCRSLLDSQGRLRSFLEVGDYASDSECDDWEDYCLLGCNTV